MLDTMRSNLKWVLRGMKGSHLRPSLTQALCDSSDLKLDTCCEVLYPYLENVTAVISQTASVWDIINDI